MKKYNLTLLLLLLVTLSCCQPKTPLVITPIKKDITTGDTLRSLFIYDHMFKPYNPQRIRVLDKYILIENPIDCGNIMMFNMETKESEGHWFKKATPSFTYSQDASYQGTVALYGFITHLLYEYNVDKGTISFGKATNMNDVDHTPDVVCRLTDSKLVGIGNLRQGLLGLYDKKLKTITFAGKYPLDEYMPPSQNQYDLLRSYRGSLAVSDDKKHIVYACKALGYIACYTFEDDKLSFAWEKRLTENKYKRKVNCLDFEPDHQTGFKDVKIINDHIYALYSGSYYDSKKNLATPVRNKVMVYNLDGVLLAEYTVSDTLVYIDVDKDEKYLYATSVSTGTEEELSSLMRYPLSSLNSK